jgi:hypothetical protein
VLPNLFLFLKLQFFVLVSRKFLLNTMAFHGVSPKIMGL